MFITHDAFRCDFSGLFGVPSQSHWTATELGTNQIWFIATISQVAGPGNDIFEFRRTLFLSDFDQVLQCIEALQTPQQRLISVNVVTPASINGSKDWKIDRLARVLRASEPDNPSQLVQIYETSNGERYSHSMMETSTQDLEIGTQQYVVPDVEH